MFCSESFLILQGIYSLQKRKCTQLAWIVFIPRQLVLCS